MAFSSNLVEISGGLPRIHTTGVSFVEFAITNLTTLTGAIQFSYDMIAENSVLPSGRYSNETTLIWSPTQTGEDLQARYTNRVWHAFKVRTPTHMAQSVQQPGTVGNNAYDPDLTDLIPGQDAHFQFSTRLPEGTMPLTITSFLPAIPQQDPFDIQSAEVLVMGPNLTSTLTDPEITMIDTDGDGINDKVVFNFGNVTNTADNRSGPGDEIVIQIVANVTDIPVNQNGIEWPHRIEMSVGDGAPVISDQTTVEVRSPTDPTAQSGQNTGQTPGQNPDQPYVLNQMTLKIVDPEGDIPPEIKEAVPELTKEEWHEWVNTTEKLDSTFNIIINHRTRQSVTYKIRPKSGGDSGSGDGAPEQPPSGNRPGGTPLEETPPPIVPPPGGGGPTPPTTTTTTTTTTTSTTTTTIFVPPTLPDPGVSPGGV